MIRGLQGEMVSIPASPESYKAFIPFALPPSPPLEFNDELLDLLEQANRSLGRLDGFSTFVPDMDASLFLYYYVRKEAVLSSQIEGTQSSLSDLLMFESKEVPGVPLDDVNEVSSYVRALNTGTQRLHEGAPLTTRLIRDIHRILLDQGRGKQKQPGEFRQSQNWIGGTRPGNALFVPPPHTEIADCLSALEKFINDIPIKTPTLIKAALIHVQFETIHPFLDGNGRIGRLLIPLLLVYENVLKEPLLYLSLYFKTHRQRYYELLQEVRLHGNWEAWLLFFLEGVRDTADQAIVIPVRLREKLNTDRELIVERLGRAAATAIKLHDYVQTHPFFTIPMAVGALNLTHQAITNSVGNLQHLKILREVGSRRRNRLFAYEEYLRLLDDRAQTAL